MPCLGGELTGTCSAGLANGGSPGIAPYRKFVMSLPIQAAGHQRQLQVAVDTFRATAEEEASRRVTEPPGRLGRRKLVNRIGPQCLVLPVRGVRRLKKVIGDC